MNPVESKLTRVHNLVKEGEIDGASRLCAEVLTENPDDPKVLSVMAYVYMQVERFGIAKALLEKAIEKLPISELWNNIGMCEMGCMRWDKAERALKMALRIDPKNSAAMNNLALVYVNKCEPGLAIEWSEKSQALRGEDPALMETYGYANLMLGRWEKGWQGFEGGLNGKIRRPRTYQNEPYWDGSPVKTLVIRGEQGIGDEISFASVHMDALKRTENIVIECDARLEGLFRRSFPVPVVGTRFQPEVPWAGRIAIDAHVLSGSLCKYFRNRDEEFSGKPYLVADSERRIQWRALLDSMGTKPKIGIAWTGGRHATNASRRSLGLEALLPILRQDATFISLQYRDPRMEIKEFEDAHGIKVHHWARAAEAVDYDETAALVAELDLVISVQTAVVHLAGALGKECWVLVPSKPHWRYGMHGDTMPWYDSVKLFRQRGGDWGEIINHVAGGVSKRFGA